MIISWQAFRDSIGLACAEDLGTGTYTVGLELCAVLSLAKRHDVKRICEIGTAYGDTAAALANLLPNANVQTFDVCREMGGYDPRSRYAAREVRMQADVGRACVGLPNVEVHCLPGSKYIADSVKAFGPYDFIFIDGDHTWRAVADDTKLALAAAADNAVLVWDDYWYYCQEVAYFIDLLNERVGNLICHVIDTHVCFTPLNRETRAKFMAEVADL